MNIWLKISLYVVFGLMASIFGYQTVDAYKKSSKSDKAPSALRLKLGEELDSDPVLPAQPENDSTTISETDSSQASENLDTEVSSADSANKEATAENSELAASKTTQSEPNEEEGDDQESESQGMGIGTKAGIFFLSLIALALLVARDITEWFANRAVKTLSNDEDELATDDTYEQAEQLWANGEPIQAVEMFRVYLKKYPNQVHASFRIAEIYEKDLNNFLAAALEYEELLEKKLPRDRWGWAAIHLCNLYSGKLNQPDKALNLLRRLSEEYPDTPAGEKATSRLKQIEGAV